MFQPATHSVETIELMKQKQLTELTEKWSEKFSIWHPSTQPKKATAVQIETTTMVSEESS